MVQYIFSTTTKGPVVKSIGNDGACDYRPKDGKDRQRAVLITQGEPSERSGPGKTHAAVGEEHTRDSNAVQEVTTSTLATSTADIRKNQSKSRVTFNSRVRVRHVMHHSEYTVAELNQCWYTRKDYVKISKQCQKEVAKLNAGQTLRDKKYCSRGLERYIINTAAFPAITEDERLIVRIQGLRSVIRKQSISDVLDMQYIFHLKQLQKDIRTGEESEASQCSMSNELSNAYSRAASRCQVLANLVGLRDRRWVERNAMG